MHDLNPAISDASRAENIAAALAGSDAFTSALGTANGLTALAESGAQRAGDGAPQGEQPQGEAWPTAAATASAESAAEPRHAVRGVGNHPVVRPPQSDPYSQLGELIRANR